MVTYWEELLRNLNLQFTVRPWLKKVLSTLTPSELYQLISEKKVLSIMPDFNMCLLKSIRLKDLVHMIEEDFPMLYSIFLQPDQKNLQNPAPGLKWLNNWLNVLKYTHIKMEDRKREFEKMQENRRREFDKMLDRFPILFYPKR